MLRCIEKNEACLENKKCKVCKLDSCKEVIKMIEIQEKNIRKEKLEKLNKQLPKICRNCSQLEIIDLDNMKVRCVYLVKNECLIGGMKNENND